MAMKAYYVQCKVALGNFETEFYVVVDRSSAFVNRNNVKTLHPPEPNKEVEGQVLAYLVTEEHDKALVQLPGEPVVGGLRTWVSKSALATT